MQGFINENIKYSFFFFNERGYTKGEMGDIEMIMVKRKVLIYISVVLLI